MEIEVKGHSGCSIEISRDGQQLFVHKSTSAPHYIDRLYKQALKQQAAAGLEYQFIRVPSIFHIEKKVNYMGMRMEYVYSKNFIDHFENAGFEQVNYFIEAFNLFLKKEVENSTLQRVSSAIVKAKFENVKMIVCANPILNQDKEICRLLELSGNVFAMMPCNLELPVGTCHGDLTFSNILFNGNNYYLIDFLDSFIESPLIDMVKLRQDTAHHWSTLMYTGHYDSTRFSIICNKIDKDLDCCFSQYDWYRNYYKTFQLMNFLRILQYAHEERVIDYLKIVITDILNSYG